MPKTALRTLQVEPPPLASQMVVFGLALQLVYGGRPEAIAGTLVWTYAELPMFVVLIVCLSRWRARDVRTSRQRQKAEDAELDSYNEYLASLSRRRNES